MQITINYLAVLIAALASMVLGMAWYSPAIFGKKWMNYMGWNSDTIVDSKGVKDQGITKSHVINYIAAFVMAFIIAYLIKILGVADISGAFILSILLWLGFITTTGLGSVLWEKRPWGYYFINTFYYLLSIFAQALILTYWG